MLMKTEVLHVSLLTVLMTLFISTIASASPTVVRFLGLPVYFLNLH